MKWTLIIFLLYTVLNSYAQGKGKLSYGDSLESKLPITKTDTGRIKLLFALGRYFQFISPQKSTAYFDEELHLAQKIKSDTDICNVYSYCGENLILNGDFAAGKALIQKEYNLANKNDDKKRIAMALCDFGVAAQMQSDFPLAEDYFFKCLSVAEEINLKRLMPVCYINLSVLFLDESDYDKTMLYAKKAMALVERGRGRGAETKALEMMGTVAVHQKNYIEGRGHYQEALKLYQQDNNKTGEATMYSMLAQAFPDDYDSQLLFALKAQVIWDSTEPENLYAIINLGSIGISYGDMARLTSGNRQQDDKKKLFDKAEQYLKKAIQLADKTGSKQNMMLFSDSLAVVQAAFGKYKEAYNNLQVRNSLNDSIFSQDNKNKVASLEGKHEIALRDKQLEINKLELANQQKQRWILIGGVVLLLLVAGLVYNQSGQRKKANLELSLLNNQLDEADKIKTKFFNILNHDLRGPVAGFISLLHLQQNEGDLLDEIKQRAYIAKAAASAESLLETMEDLLLWSKGQMDNFKPHVRSISVESLFNYLKKSIQGKANITISFCQEQEMALDTDEHYIKTVMHNLTNNAVKALGNQPDGTIEWRCWQESGIKFLSIKDNGPGATEEQLRPLYDETATVGIKNGLGLHIVRDMAKAVGCNILVNTALEKGVEIRLVFG